MTAPAETQPTDATVSAYEALRERSLEHHSGVVAELGLSVLLRDGMLAWMRAGLAVLTGASTAPTALDTTRVSSPLRDDIVDVMVTMATSVSRSFTKERVAHEL